MGGVNDGWFWVSTRRMTFAVHVRDGLIRETAPIARRFLGQRPENLGAWLRKQGGVSRRATFALGWTWCTGNQ